MKPKKAWLIQWQWIGDHAKVEPNILHVLNPRLSAGNVIAYMKNLYLNSGTTSIEYRFESIYDSSCWEALVHDYGNIVTVGKNPELVAYKALNITYEFDIFTKIEKVKWVVPPVTKFNATTKRCEPLSQPQKMEFSIDYNRLGIHWS